MGWVPRNFRDPLLTHSCFTDPGRSYIRCVIRGLKIPVPSAIPFEYLGLSYRQMQTRVSTEALWAVRQFVAPLGGESEHLLSLF